VAEGLVAVAPAGHKGALVEVNSETDLVARNDRFQAMVGDIARLALEARGDLEKLKTLAYPGTSHDVAHYVAEMVATIGENMTVRRTACLEVTDGIIASYMHNQAAPGMGKIGVLVALDSKGSKDELAQFGRMLAMHIAATNPVALNIDSVPAETLAREKAILEEKNHGKQANVLEKIVASGLKTYAKDNTLLEQAYVHDGAKSVSQVIGELANKLGTPVVLKAYVRMQLGEGVEKKEDDFAAEVAKMSGN
ncbi:MAG TPA: translation elongation factor Ts, partial [Aestuariivirga sp.]|nr:translation elongation factor Ts [Aestuariivirga sp.]